MRLYEIAVVSEGLVLLGGLGGASGGPLFKLKLETEQLTPLDVPRPRAQAARPVITCSRDGSVALPLLRR